ncbi:hypothetical protein COY07_04730 [Candidatus Peregrinibacteria bacterium CG_4_10_14_0_2_um_filter_43_11]|nr:MAG: hypothetical protein COY07_04730 [Candidatus Peregrinibacteria bacterium CG_4_10_14_0_2_um_filter_43_11]
MKLYRLKHTFLRLSAEEKVIVLGGILILIGMFFPWYSVEYLVDQKLITQTGFSGNLGVIGFVVFLLTLMALLVVVAEHMRFRLPNFGYKKEQVVLFLTGESAFLLLLTVAIYMKDSLEFPGAQLRFGLYLALISAFFATFAAFSLLQKLQKKEVHAFFEHDENETEDLPTEKKEACRPAVILTRPHSISIELDPPANKNEEENDFGDNVEELEEEDEMVEDVEIQPAQSEKKAVHVSGMGYNQASYFSKEAGLPEKKANEKEDEEVGAIEEMEIDIPDEEEVILSASAKDDDSEMSEDEIQEEMELEHEDEITEVDEADEPPEEKTTKVNPPSMNFYED